MKYEIIQKQNKGVFDNEFTTMNSLNYIKYLNQYNLSFFLLFKLIKLLLKLKIWKKKLFNFYKNINSYNGIINWGLIVENI